MLISPNQNTISFNASFKINPYVKPKNQRTHYSPMTKLENLLSNALEAATPDDRTSRLILSSIDLATKKLRFKMLQSSNKTIVKDSIDITDTRNPFSELTEENITKIYKKLKKDTKPIIKTPAIGIFSLAKYLIFNFYAKILL